MKIKIRLFALLLMLSSAAFTAPAIAKESTTEKQELRVAQIRQRVEVIKAMDYSNMDRLQRKELRHELRGMNKELREMGPGIYISVGALIIIILLLILLL